MGVHLTAGLRRGKEIAVIRCNRAGRNAAGREEGKETKSHVGTGSLTGTDPG